MPRAIILRTFLVVCLSPYAFAQFNPSKPPAKPVKSDIKYIKCQVCELLAKNAYRQVNDLKKSLKPNKKVLNVIRSTRIVAYPLVCIPARYMVPAEQSDWTYAAG